MHYILLLIRDIISERFIELFLHKYFNIDSKENTKTHKSVWLKQIPLRGILIRDNFGKGER